MYPPNPDIKIRPFAEDDYPAVVEIANRAFPEYPETIAEVQHHDQHRNPAMLHRRFVAELEGRPVAAGQVQHYEGMFHPRKFGLEVTVDPDHRQKGVGSALFEQLRSCLEAEDPLALWTDAREDHPHSLRFVEKRGFVETMREWENHLRPDDFEPARWAGRIEAVEASGIRLATYAELEAEDPDFFRKFYEVADTVSADVPSTEPHTPADYALWVERKQSDPDLIKEGYFFALDGDRYVGLSTLSRPQSEDFLYTGLTGVRRDYRRRGIALALKLRAIQFCRERSVPLVKTWNASTNVGMLGINEALGFVKQPAWIAFALKLKEEA
jgi:GNAT superfamily N-acetyltransferase